MRALVEWAEQRVVRAKAEAAAHTNGKGYWSRGSVKRKIEEAETRLRVEQLGASLEESPGALATFLAGLRGCHARLTSELGYRPYGDEVVAALRPFAIAELHSLRDEYAEIRNQWRHECFDRDTAFQRDPVSNASEATRCVMSPGDVLDQLLLEPDREKRSATIRYFGDMVEAMKPGLARLPLGPSDLAKIRDELHSAKATAEAILNAIDAAEALHPTHLHAVREGER